MLRGYTIGVVLAMTGLIGCGGSRREVVSARAGMIVPQTGIIIDVDYDTRLDTLVPGYKIVTVAINNNMLNHFRLDVRKDRWEIQDARGRWRPAIHDLKTRRQRVWRKLPTRIREIVAYPDTIAVGDTGVFDIFVRNSINLDGFRGVRYDSAGLGRVIDVQREP